MTRSANRRRSLPLAIATAPAPTLISARSEVEVAGALLGFRKELECTIRIQDGDVGVAAGPRKFADDDGDRELGPRECDRACRRSIGKIVMLLCASVATTTMTPKYRRGLGDGGVGARLGLG